METRRGVSRGAVVALAAGLLAAACTGDPAAQMGLSPGPAWQRPDAGPDGTVPVDDFNRFVEAGRQPWNRSALRTALEFLGLGEDEVGMTRVVVRRPEADRARVAVVQSRLPDDSVEAVRYVLVLRQAEDGTWRLESARWSQRCQPGRGHQRFDPRPCT